MKFDITIRNISTETMTDIIRTLNNKLGNSKCIIEMQKSEENQENNNQNNLDIGIENDVEDEVEVEAEAETPMMTTVSSHENESNQQTFSSTDTANSVMSKRGRPKGSLNKKSLLKMKQNDQSKTIHTNPAMEIDQDNTAEKLQATPNMDVNYDEPYNEVERRRSSRITTMEIEHFAQKTHNHKAQRLHASPTTLDPQHFALKSPDMSVFDKCELESE